MTKRRPLALGAAAAIGFGSLFIAAPALAEDTASLPVTDQTEEQAPTSEDTANDAAASEETDAAEDADSTEDAEDTGELSADEAADLEKVLAASSKDADSDDEIETPTIAAAGVTAAGDFAVITVEEDGAVDASDPAVAELLSAIEDVTDRDVIHETTSDIATPLAADDVVGGAGYLSYQGSDLKSACSIGFTGWSPDGDPALITAGHCTADGSLNNIQLSIPSEQPAHRGDAATNAQWNAVGNGVVGQFGFSQFGGPRNADAENRNAYPGEEGNTQDSVNSTDIAVVNVTGDFNLHPQVTDWTTAGQDDLFASASEITSVGNPTAGPVSKSGRTTGLTSSTIKSGDIVDGYHLLWADNENTEEGDPARWVRGFQVDGLKSAGGDSGGAVFQGEKAVGVVSGGGVGYLWATSLTHALEQTSGYQVAIHIDTPEVTSHTEGAELEPGETITGTAPSNATEVSLSTQPNSGESVPVEDGEWSMTAPSEPGDYTLSYSARNGFNSSESVEFNFSVVEGNVAAPVVTSPAPNSTVTAPVESIEGTGIPGAELTMEGDVGSTVDVDEDGNWSVPTSLEAGEYTIQLFQTVDGEDSRTITVSFTVEDEGSETAPVEVTSISDGDEFELADAPTSVSGTAEPGEIVEVSIAAEDGGSGEAGVGTAAAANVGSTQAVEVGNDGSWTHELDYEPAVGTYTLTYGYEGETGDTLSFTIADTDDGNQPPNDDDDDSSDGGEDGNDGSGNDGSGDKGDDQLPVTGLDSMSLLPYIGAAAAMVLIGAAVTLLAARRQQGGAAGEG